VAHEQRRSSRDGVPAGLPARAGVPEGRPRDPLGCVRNGHPEKSLLVRMERVESWLAVIQRLSLATLCGVGTLLLKFVGAWIESLMKGS